MKRYVLLVPLAGFLAGGAIVPALADRPQPAGEARESDVLQGTTLTLPAAIATAERQTGGKAFDAGTDIDHGIPRVVVETNGTTGVQTVIIDAQSGRIMGTHAGGEAD